MTGKFVFAIAITLIALVNVMQGSDLPRAAGNDWAIPKAGRLSADSETNASPIVFSKMLFFDPRLSREVSMSCGTCHSPRFGWSDGLPTARALQNKVPGRASPTALYAGDNMIRMWHGR